MLVEAVNAYLALVIDRIADRGSSITHWNVTGQEIGNTFSGFRLAMAWDFTELNPTVKTSGGYPGQVDLVAKFAEHALAVAGEHAPEIRLGSALDLPDREAYDAIITDPPYYDAVPYADLSDFFFVWLRRSLNGQGGMAFDTEVVPKQGELVSNAGLFDKDETAAKRYYEIGMAQAFARAYQALKPDGIMVIVFAHKEVDAWETLVGAMIQAGWTVSASWPIDTERGGRTRAVNSAALASSIWLVCRKRSEDAGIGRYGDVMRRMQERITERLRYFWDLNISGPDFIWAAVGPALEAYSSFREVRRLDGSLFTVGEFLREVRRLVADFALGQILHGASTGTLDETTRYYLMHRYSFKMGPAPGGECILLAQGYGLNLDELRGQRGILISAKAEKKVALDVEDEVTEASGEDEDVGQTKKASGNDLRLLGFDERSHPELGEPLPSGGLPMVDMLHRLMRLWAAGQVDAVSEYAGAHGLGSESAAFWALAQSVLEMAEPKSRERTLLEALVSWGRRRTARAATERAQVESVPLPGMSRD
jgi:adenine-specific DNA methylase